MSFLKVWWLSCSLRIGCTNFKSSSRIGGDRQNNLIILKLELFLRLWWHYFHFLGYFWILPESVFHDPLDILMGANRLLIFDFLFVFDSRFRLHILYDLEHRINLVINFVNIFYFGNELSVFASGLSWKIALSFCLLVQ